MANFEGKITLNRETSELEVKGKFKLTLEELDAVTGGGNIPEGSKVVSVSDSCENWTEKCGVQGFDAFLEGGGAAGVGGGHAGILAGGGSAGISVGQEKLCATCDYCQRDAGVFYCTLPA